MAIIDPNGLFLGERLSWCSDEAQLHFTRLYCAANNYARMELDYKRIVSKAYSSFKKPINEAKFWQLIREYRANFLLFVWEVDGILWGQWQTNDRYLPRHKNAEDKRSPAPPKDAQDKFRQDYLVKKNKSIRNELLADLRKVALKAADLLPLGRAGVGVGEGVGEDPIAPSKLDAEATPRTVFLELPTLQQPFAVSDRELGSWSALYPAVDVKQSVRNMRGWLESDPRRRKTPQGMARFIHNWLRGDQDKARVPANPAQPAKVRTLTREEAMQR